LNDPFAIAEQYLQQEEEHPRAWLTQAIRNGAALRAIKICSGILKADIWIVLDSSFEPPPGDGLAVFYAEELPPLKTKSPEELKSIHKIKQALGSGSRVRE
jgi:hypothetical protein